MIPTSRPIYKVHDLRVHFQLHWMHLHSQGMIDEAILPYDILPEHFYKNSLIDYVFEKQLYDILPNTQGVNAEEKGNAFSYTQGEKNINNLTHVADSPGFWNPSTQAFASILSKFSGTHIQLYNRLENFIVPEHLQEARDILASHGYVEDPNPPTGTQKGFDIANLNAGSLQDIRFKIKYTPLNDINLFTYKERKDQSEIKSFQFHNQQADVLDSKVLGEIHDKIIQRGSGASRSIVYIHDSFDEILPIGCQIDSYILTAIEYTINYGNIVANYFLDEFYVKLQRYAAVLEQYRQFSIPKNNIVLRQRTEELFAAFSETHAANVTPLTRADYLGAKEDVEIDLFKLGSVVIAANSFSFNNSLVFQAEFESNTYAGFKSTADGSERRNEPVLYTDSNGRINE